MGEFEEDIWSDLDMDYLNDADYIHQMEVALDWDGRVNPCPDCDFGEVISESQFGVPVPMAAWLCSAGCGWSA